ncbi:hypothetical protein SAMN02745945_02008 [Peptoclostridium litorale DSM 5388]|uniref:Uncharacterized protein n=3 Tax=Peptoclostridium litorale TaxID=1557 RepID=A0A069RHK7_PEPLI|nr:hypothetical protein CLIT_4c01150 [Peptoclostridium litorale DSM 5388]SIO15032.1 hypothetical protein SAMN02745945_02008 [Peptoclostridium litorale DSM 5388]
MEHIKKILISTAAVFFVFAVFFLLPKEQRLSANVRIAASNDSSGMLLDYMIRNKDKSGNIKNLDVESYILGDC